jgi:glycosyltransferase involved in cell wall biosynthesis
MPLRVLLVSANPIWTAIEATHAFLLGAFDPSEVEVRVACTSQVSPNGGATVAERFRAIPNTSVKTVDFGPSIHGATRAKGLELARRSPIVPAAFARLALHVIRHRIDVIHCSQKPYDALFGVALAKATGRASVLHMHVKHGDWFTRPVKWAVANASLVVGVSKFTADSCIAGGVPAEKTRSVLNGFDMNSWRAEGDGLKVRRELGISDTAPVVVSIGRLNQWKGQWRLIDALPAIRAAYPDVRLILVGQEDVMGNGGKGYREELDARARALGVADAVIFAGFRRDIPDVLAASTLFAFPSWEEPFGMVYVEAMASRKPVVALASGGANEIVEHGKTGLLVDPEEKGGLSRAIVELLADPERQRMMGAAGRERVAQLFVPHQKSQEMTALYREAVARSKGRRQGWSRIWQATGDEKTQATRAPAPLANQGVSGEGLLEWPPVAPSAPPLSPARGP